jgi:hypothetical protein
LAECRSERGGESDDRSDERRAIAHQPDSEAGNESSERDHRAVDRASGGVRERAPVGSFDPSALDGYHASDPELVASTLLDPLFARRNRFTLDWTGAWRLDNSSEWLDEECPFMVEVVFDDPVPVRPERLIAQGLGLSRNEVRRRIKCDIPLHRPTSTGFTFSVMDEVRSG